MQSNITEIDKSIIKEAEKIIPDLYKSNIYQNITQQESTIEEYTKTISKNDVKKEIEQVMKNIDFKIHNCSNAIDNLINLFKRLKVSNIADVSPTTYFFKNPDPESLLKLPNEIEKYQKIANLAKFIIDNNFMFENGKDTVNFIPDILGNDFGKFIKENQKSFIFWQIFAYLVKQFDSPYIYLDLFASADIVYKYEVPKLFDKPEEFKPPFPLGNKKPFDNKKPFNNKRSPNTSSMPSTPSTGGANYEEKTNNKTYNKTDNKVFNKNGKPGFEKKPFDQSLVKKYFTKEDYTKILKNIQFNSKGRFENLFKYSNDKIREFIKATFSEFINPYSDEIRDASNKKPIPYKNENSKSKIQLLYKLKDDKTRDNMLIPDEDFKVIQQEPIRILDSVYDIFNKELEYKYDEVIKLLEPFHKERIFSKIKNSFSKIEEAMRKIMFIETNYKDKKSIIKCILYDNADNELTENLAYMPLTNIKELIKRFHIEGANIKFEDAILGNYTDDIELYHHLFAIGNAVISGYFLNPNKSIASLMEKKVVKNKEAQQKFIGINEIFDKYKPKPELIQYELINLYLQKYDIMFINFLHVFRFPAGKTVFNNIRLNVYRFLIGYYSVYKIILIDYITRLNNKYDIPIPSSMYNKQNKMQMMPKKATTIPEILSVLPEKYLIEIRRKEKEIIEKYPTKTPERAELVEKLKEFVKKTYDNYVEEFKPIPEYVPKSVANMSNANTSEINANKNKNYNKQLKNLFEN